MNQLLFDRSVGALDHNAFARLQTVRLLSSFGPVPHVRLDGGGGGATSEERDARSSNASGSRPGEASMRDGNSSGETTDGRKPVWAHRSGVNSLALERFEGRILISGGTDATIKVWDLEQHANPHLPQTLTPVAIIPRAVPETVMGAQQPRSSTLVQHMSGQRRGLSSRPVYRVSREEPRPAGGPPMSVAQGEGDGHRFGITHLDFFPFDRDAFLSSSYDGTLRLWSTGFSPNGGSPKLAGKFVVDGDHALTAHGGAGGKVYTFALSPVGHHLLVACGTQQPAVRLVDLRSGSAVQSLLMSSSTASTASGSTSTSLTSTAGTAKRADTGAVLSLAWHPSREHVLAGGSVDGAVRIWDVRRAGRGSVLGLLDAEDAVGPFGRRCGYAGGGTNHGGSGIPTRLSAKAHRGPVNSLTWTDDGAGRFLVSSGHDEARLRVWDAATGANTLAAFSPRVRNPPRLATLHPVALSHGADSPGDILLWPNDNGELLFVDVHEGTVVGSLRVPGGHLSSVPRPSDNSNNYVTSGTARHAGKHIAGGRRDADASRELTHASPRRVTAVAWRGGGGGGTSLHGPVLGGTNGPGGAIYTAHADGMVRYWAPRLEDDGEGGLGYDGEDRVEVDTEEKREETARKRKALDDAFRSLMGRNVTFT